MIIAVCGVQQNRRCSEQRCFEFLYSAANGSTSHEYSEQHQASLYEVKRADQIDGARVEQKARQPLGVNIRMFLY